MTRGDWRLAAQVAQRDATESITLRQRRQSVKLVQPSAVPALPSIKIIGLAGSLAALVTLAQNYNNNASPLKQPGVV